VLDPIEPHFRFGNKAARLSRWPKWITHNPRRIHPNILARLKTAIGTLYELQELPGGVDIAVTA
jgi:hypothetical protein